MNFSWEVFWSHLLTTDFFQAALTTVWLAVTAQAAGIIVGLVMALLELSDNIVLRSLSQFYIWIWRGVPKLVQLFLYSSDYLSWEFD
jgi:polar amino acid transport system permease protein